MNRLIKGFIVGTVVLLLGIVIFHVSLHRTKIVPRKSVTIVRPIGFFSFVRYTVDFSGNEKVSEQVTFYGFFSEDAECVYSRHYGRITHVFGTSKEYDLVWEPDFPNSVRHFASTNREPYEKYEFVFDNFLDKRNILYSKYKDIVEQAKQVIR